MYFIEVSEMVKISRIVEMMASATSQTIEIGHCALMGSAMNQWALEVKCCPLNHHGNLQWQNLIEYCPGAKVEVKPNDVMVTLPPLKEALLVAVFGEPGENDMKRMQMAIFGRKPTKGKDWRIYIELYDDTITTSQVTCCKIHER